MRAPRAPVTTTVPPGWLSSLASSSFVCFRFYSTVSLFGRVLEVVRQAATRRARRAWCCWESKVCQQTTARCKRRRSLSSKERCFFSVLASEERWWTIDRKHHEGSNKQQASNASMQEVGLLVCWFSLSVRFHGRRRSDSPLWSFPNSLRICVSGM